MSWCDGQKVCLLGSFATSSSTLVTMVFDPRDSSYTSEVGSRGRGVTGRPGPRPLLQAGQTARSPSTTASERFCWDPQESTDSHREQRFGSSDSTENNEKSHYIRRHRRRGAMSGYGSLGHNDVLEVSGDEGSSTGNTRFGSGPGLRYGTPPHGRKSRAQEIEEAWNDEEWSPSSPKIPEEGPAHHYRSASSSVHSMDQSGITTPPRSPGSPEVISVRVVRHKMIADNERLFARIISDSRFAPCSPVTTQSRWSTSSDEQQDTSEGCQGVASRESAAHGESSKVHTLGRRVR